MNRNQRLKEVRDIEAMRKGYKGLEGKFSQIARWLGQPIFHQGSLFVSQTFLDDPYELPDEDQIPMMDEDERSYEVGVQFDGLSRGINLTISVQFHLREITVRHKGDIVYKEIAGELEGFAPTDEWEDSIDKLFKLVKKLEKEQRPFRAMEKTIEKNKERKMILDELRMKWGL